MPTTVWSTTNKSSGIVIGGSTAGNGGVAIQNTGAYSLVRSVGSKSTGKFHAEVRVDVLGVDWGIGISNATQVLSNYVGSSVNSLGYFQDGRIWRNAVNIASTTGFAVGSIVEIEIDADAQTVQFRPSSGASWSAPQSLSSLGAGPYYLAWTADVVSAQNTLNGGDTTFDGAMSVGYSAWNVSGEVWNASDKSATISLATINPLGAIANSSTNPGLTANRKFATANAYWEITSVAQSSTFAIGIADQAWNASSTTLLGGDNLGIALREDGTVRLNNVTLATIFTFTQGDVIQVAVRTAERTIFFKKNNAGNWNNTGGADPATNTGGIDYSSMTFSSVMPAWGASVVSPKQAITAAFSSVNWQFSAPSGFASPDITDILGNSRTVAQANTSPVLEVNVSSPVLGRNYGQTNNDPKTAVHMYNGTTQTAISGVTKEATVPVSGRKVRLYDQATGEFLGEYKSDPSTGNYSIPALGRTAVYVVGIDPGFPAQIFDNLTPV